MNSYTKPFSVLIMILLVLQCCVLCVYGIGYSESKLFRIVVCFLGLGLIITPVVMKTLKRTVEEKSSRAELIGLLYLFYMLISPWIRFRDADMPVQSYFSYLAVSSSAMLLASASLGFFITAFIATVKPPPVSEGLEPTPVVRVLRGVISLGLLFFASYCFFPVLSMISPFFFENNPYSMEPDSYGFLVALFAGNPWAWLVNLAISTFVYYKFYAAWILKHEY